MVLHWDWGVDSRGRERQRRDRLPPGLLGAAPGRGHHHLHLLGIALGVYTALRQYKLADRAWQFISIAMINLPVPVVGLGGIVLVAISLNQSLGHSVVFVSGGASSVGVEGGFFPVLLDRIQHLILPTITLVVIQYAGLHLLQRSMVLDTINADYVRTARAKGLTRGVAVRRHALRTAIIPVAVGIAFAIPAVFTGAVLTETIFGWEGGMAGTSSPRSTPTTSTVSSRSPHSVRWRPRSVRSSPTSRSSISIRECG